LKRDACHGKRGKAKTRLGFGKRGETVGGSCAFRDFGAIAARQLASASALRGDERDEVDAACYRHANHHLRQAGA
jgi:hypothetical protein